jgi:hypothetical protein
MTHDGPCRFAWFISTLDESQFDDEPTLYWTQETADDIRRDLEGIPVWPTAQVERSLGMEAPDRGEND